MKTMKNLLERFVQMNRGTKTLSRKEKVLPRVVKRKLWKTMIIYSQKEHSIW